MMRCRATRHQDLPAAGHPTDYRRPTRLDGSDGVLRGKPAIRAYWMRGVELIPDLHFEVVGVYVGLSTVVINYRNQKGGLVNEVLIFDGPLVVSGHGTYLGNDANPAGATGG